MARRTIDDVEAEIAEAKENIAKLRAELNYRKNLGDRLAQTIEERVSGKAVGAYSTFPVAHSGAFAIEVRVYARR